MSHLAAQRSHPVVASDSFALSQLGPGVALLTYRSTHMNGFDQAPDGWETWACFPSIATLGCATDPIEPRTHERLVMSPVLASPDQAGVWSMVVPIARGE